MEEGAALDFIKNLTISDLMVKDMISVSADSLVKEAASTMLSNKVNSVAVEKENTIVGLLTDKDFLRAFISNRELQDLKVSEVMLPSMVTVKPNMSLIDATKTMGKNNVTHLFVRDQGEVVGLVSLKDVLNVFYGALVEAMGHEA
ncbi:MAG: cyclic nucleotide-binding/CBS domain-containing protein [Candidatus Hydrothermarchaeales archaeon]